MSSWHPGGSVLEANPTEKENIVWKAQLNCVYTWQNRSKPGVAQFDAPLHTFLGIYDFRKQT